MQIVINKKNIQKSRLNHSSIHEGIMGLLLKIPLLKRERGSCSPYLFVTRLTREIK